MPKVLAFAIHNTAPWWTYIMRNLGFAEGFVFSDLRGEGDFNTVDDFYAAMAGDAKSQALAAFGTAGCADIVRRCRVLRNMPPDRATAMIGGMYTAISKVFDEVRPDLAMALTIDRYTTDIAARIAEQRGIQFLEMTASIIPSEVMLLKRGVLQPLWTPTDAEIDHRVDQVYDPNFVPSYVGNELRFTRGKFLKTVGYFEVRGMAFDVLRRVKRDPLNLHYLDSLRRLSHKVRLSDMAVLDLLDTEWRTQIDATDPAKRVFLGLQLFPEASMDYWLNAADMLDHDKVILAYCDVLGAAGYQVFVKDHPLQFGFRQIGLMRELSRRPHVSLVPYGVSAQAMIALCSVSVTLTGTIGFQAALAGLCSVVSDPYYSTEGYFVQVRRFDEIDGVPGRIAGFHRSGSDPAVRREIVRKLAGGSVPGDYFTFRRFDGDDPERRAAIAPLIASLQSFLPGFAENPDGIIPHARDQRHG